MVTFRQQLLANSNGGTVRNALLTLEGGASGMSFAHDVVTTLNLYSFEEVASIVRFDALMNNKYETTTTFINLDTQIYNTIEVEVNL